MNRCSLVLLLACPVLAQNARVTLQAQNIGMPTVIGAPYSAEQVMESSQTLADGTHITRKPTSRMMYRDSQGRTRTEGNPIDGVVRISDPVGGYSYILDTAHKVAHRAKLAPRVPRRARAAAETPPPRRELPKVAMESLGQQVMEGVLVNGDKATFTIAAGARGNDRPMVETTESWYSPELKLMVLMKDTSPMRGDSTTKLVNLNRGEPDATLFQAPPDYQVVDEEGSFTIEVTRPAAP